MKNNKGFTLIELLVVVVILLGISLVAIPNISNSLSKRKEKEYQNTKETLIEYANIYVNKNINIYNCLKQNTNGYISLEDIANANNIKIDNKYKYGVIYYNQETQDLDWKEVINNNRPKDCLQ